MPGTRVGLIVGANPDKKTYTVAGYARCHGVTIPPDQAAGTTSTRFRRERRHTPVFLLERGGVLFGTEVSWVDDAIYDAALRRWASLGYTIVELAPERLRATLAADSCDMDDYPFPE